jgi:hypothetical protein
MYGYPFVILFYWGIYVHYDEHSTIEFMRGLTMNLFSAGADEFLEFSIRGVMRRPIPQAPPIFPQH